MSSCGGEFSSLDDSYPGGTAPHLFEIATRTTDSNIHTAKGQKNVVVVRDANNEWKVYSAEDIKDVLQLQVDVATEPTAK
jgi:hypothetical protein